MKNICIYGLGAVGGLVAARLAAAGITVRAVARGHTLAATRARGLELRETLDGQPVVTRHAITVAEHPAELGVQDLVIVAVKTTGLGGVARDIALACNDCHDPYKPLP